MEDDDILQELLNADPAGISISSSTVFRIWTLCTKHRCPGAAMVSAFHRLNPRSTRSVVSNEEIVSNLLSLFHSWHMISRSRSFFCSHFFQYPGSQLQMYFLPWTGVSLTGLGSTSGCCTLTTASHLWLLGVLKRPVGKPRPICSA